MGVEERYSHPPSIAARLRPSLGATAAARDAVSPGRYHYTQLIWPPGARTMTVHVGGASAGRVAESVNVGQVDHGAVAFSGGSWTVTRSCDSGECDPGFSGSADVFATPFIVTANGRRSPLTLSIAVTAS